MDPTPGACFLSRYGRTCRIETVEPWTDPETGESAEVVTWTDEGGRSKNSARIDLFPLEVERWL